MTLTILAILALLIGIIIFLILSKDDKAKKTVPMRSVRKRTEREAKSPPIDPLKSHILEGLNYITSNPKTVEPKSQKPHQISELGKEIIDSVKSRVGDMKEFASVNEVSLALDDPNVDMSKIARKISTDPVLSNKILRVANSAYFGSRMAIDSINHALAVLGLINIRSILFYNMLSKQSYGKQIQQNPIYRSLWQHSVSTATCGVYLADAFEGLNKGRLYTLGLLHDIGKFIMLEWIREKQIDDGFMLPFGEKECIIKEDEIGGVNHAVIGRIAFEGCGLSEQMLRLIEIHHFPSFYSKGYLVMKEEDKKYLSALYLANQIAKLFVDEDEKKIYAVQSLPTSYYDLVSLNKVKDIFSDDHVHSEIMKTQSLTESYVV